MSHARLGSSVRPRPGQQRRFGISPFRAGLRGSAGGACSAPNQIAATKRSLVPALHRCYRHGMEPVVVWSDGTRQCVLHRVDGLYELHFHEGSRVIRIETAETEAEARRKAMESMQLRPQPIESAPTSDIR